MKRGLVISGGGSTGAFGVGIVDYLYNHNNVKWDVFVGSSTGALISTIAATGNVQKLIDEYTTVSNDTIYNVSPFTKKDKLKKFNAIFRLIRGKKSLGEAENLKKKLKNAFTISDYEETIKNNKTVIVSATNATQSTTEYKYQTIESYLDFIDWVFASASVPVLFDVLEKNGYQYLDGALIEPIPLQKAIDEGCEEIDVILFKPIKLINQDKMDTVFEVAIRALNIMYDEIYKNDLIIGNLYAKEKNIKINVYRTPKQISNNSYVFNKEDMMQWYKDGFEFAKSESQKKYEIKK